MLHLPDNGYRVYQVALVNTKVRALISEKKRHRYFDERWANVQVKDVVARDEGEAWELICERFPPEDGFVVEAIRQPQE
jgi:hypothetical protein